MSGLGNRVKPSVTQTRASSEQRRLSGLSVTTTGGMCAFAVASWRFQCLGLRGGVPHRCVCVRMQRCCIRGERWTRTHTVLNSLLMHKSVLSTSPQPQQFHSQNPAGRPECRPVCTAVHGLGPLFKRPLALAEFQQARHGLRRTPEASDVNSRSLRLYTPADNSA